MIELKLVDESSFQAVLDLKISEADERARFVGCSSHSHFAVLQYPNGKSLFYKDFPFYLV